MPYENNATAIPEWAAAVAALADRIVGCGTGPRMQLRQIDALTRSFTVQARDGVLQIEATDASAACVAMHHYLRTACTSAISWDTPTPLGLTELPDLAPTSKTARVPDTYYLNFCTFSYSTAFWGWPEWEAEIDWMALHGITMPLAAVGHEAVLYTALQQAGLDEETVRTYLGGPGYLPFQYMGCLDSFDGPLSREWIEEHLQLGRRILDRERSLGMRPVLPAFAGNVPTELASTHVQQREWQGFWTTVLTPSSPLYRRLTATIAATQDNLLGTDNLYAADPFIEMVPVDDDPGYPGRVAEQTLAGLTDADPDAMWIMQAWPFSYQARFWTDDRVQRFLDDIDDNRIHLLDLWAEQKPQWDRFAGFSGKSWSWCGLLNFGGRTDPVGNFDKMITELERALSSPTPPAGLGLTMEGIHNNPLFFELAADLSWTGYPDISSWLSTAIPQRYGPNTPTQAIDAWRDLAATVYAREAPIRPNEFAGIVTQRPRYDLLDRADTVSAALWFDTERFTSGWEKLLHVAESCTRAVPAPLERDLADITTAALVRLADQRFVDIARSAAEQRVDNAELTRFLQVFSDLDSVLLTRPELRWSTWESDAARWEDTVAGAVDGSPGPAVRNARRLLTTWEARAGSNLDDYAARLWGGLVTGYYRPRWAAWAEGLRFAVQQDRPAAHEWLSHRLQQLADDVIDNGIQTSPQPARTSTTHATRLIYDRTGPELAALSRHRTVGASR